MKSYILGANRELSLLFQTYPTVSAMAADLILPTAMWVEKGV